MDRDRHRRRGGCTDCRGAAAGYGRRHSTEPSLLQALPESQLFPLMNLLADSLGVRCDYCHVQAKPDLTKTPSNLGGWVWDSDDKEPKRSAREMMRMVIDLNAGCTSTSGRVCCGVR